MEFKVGQTVRFTKEFVEYAQRKVRSRFDSWEQIYRCGSKTLSILKIEKPSWGFGHTISAHVVGVPHIYRVTVDPGGMFLGRVQVFETSDECCDSPQPDVSETCSKCGAVGEVSGMCCKCPSCGHIIWGI